MAAIRYLLKPGPSPSPNLKEMLMGRIYRFLVDTNSAASVLPAGADYSASAAI
jgi:hypothetical protein